METKVPQRWQGILWSRSIESLDWKKDQAYIIHQVLMHGSLEDIADLMNQYGKAVVKQVFIDQPKKIYTPQAFNFIKNYLLGISENLPSEKYVRVIFEQNLSSKKRAGIRSRIGRTMSEKTFLTNFKLVLDELLDELRSLPAGGADWNEKPGEWTICQIAHHLEDDGDLWGFLIKRAIAVSGANARFEGFPGNEVWAEKLHFATRPLVCSVARIQTSRDSLADLLEASPEGYQNTLKFFGEDGKPAGEMTVQKMVEMITEHSREHLETIRRIKASH